MKAPPSLLQGSPNESRDDVTIISSSLDRLDLIDFLKKSFSIKIREHFRAKHWKPIFTLRGPGNPTQVLIEIIFLWLSHIISIAAIDGLLKFARAWEKYSGGGFWRHQKQKMISQHISLFGGTRPPASRKMFIEKALLFGMGHSTVFHHIYGFLKPWPQHFCHSCIVKCDLDVVTRNTGFSLFFGHWKCSSHSKRIIEAYRAERINI